MFSVVIVGCQRVSRTLEYNPRMNINWWRVKMMEIVQKNSHQIASALKLWSSEYSYEINLRHCELFDFPQKRNYNHVFYQ